MKKIWLPVAVVYFASLISACSNNQNKSGNTSGQDTGRQACINTINAVEKNMKTLTTLDTYNANLAITAYTKFSGGYPNDSLAPVFLFKAASMAMSSGQYQRALSFYDNIQAKYPGYKQISDCIFVEGFIYDSFLKDTARAHAKYLQVVTKYPDNNLASQAKAAISALGKSDEELMKEFEEKNKKEGKKPI
jgi:TolA-binding protein